MYNDRFSKKSRTELDFRHIRPASISLCPVKMLDRFRYNVFTDFANTLFVEITDSFSRLGRKFLGFFIILLISTQLGNICMSEVMTLPPRWTKLKKHDIQQEYWRCDKRFITCSAGRRSGKTEIAKRRFVKRTMFFNSHPNGRFVCSAPTHAQTKEIFWEDMLALVPDWMVLRKPTLTPVPTIYLINGVRIQLIGMDKAERIEGSPLDGILLDEYGNMKEEAWDLHIRPSLSTPDRLGWAMLIGVPEGRNHYYKKVKYAEKETSEDWAHFHWFSADILPASEIKAAKESMDELSFQQEYEGSFLNFNGRAYYPYSEDINHSPVTYDKDQPLIFCFDFNVSPGVCGILQEQYLSKADEIAKKTTTCAIDEVWIAKDSNTHKVCAKLIEDWKSHQGAVHCYGDATGGAKTTQSIAGSDWEIIYQILKPVFGERLSMRQKRSNPRERARINAMNGRIKSASGIVRFLVNPYYCPHIVEDFEGVALKKDGSGEIDKGNAPELTHISDGIGYYIEQKFPLAGGGVTVQEI